MNDVDIFDNSIRNIKEMITYFKDRNRESKKEFKNYRTLTSKIESIQLVGTIEANKTSVISSATGVSLIWVPIFVGFACAIF